MTGLSVIGFATLYLALLFAVAWLGDRVSRDKPFLPHGTARAAVAYALTLAIYNTSWSFYGSVGRASRTGIDFLPIYLAPTLLLLFAQPVIRRIIALSRTQNVTSIADFIAARYGKSQAVAAFVTLAALFVMLPYIALQLKAVAASFDVLTGAVAGNGITAPFWQDTAFWVATSMALFSIVFGVRHIHAREHHRGLMLAIAFESLVKIATFLIVAVFIVYGTAGGPGTLFSKAATDARLSHVLDVDLSNPTWITNTVISLFAFLCLPHTFHVAFVEVEKIRDASPSAWMYPLYLLILSIFMLPLAIAGLSILGPDVNPDTYMIHLPLAAGSNTMAFVAFIGGLSAATGMIIVAAISLSTMLCNDVVMPAVMRNRGFNGLDNVGALLLRTRRIAVVLILLLAFLSHRLVDQRFPLTSMGLLSFVGVAQFGPVFLGGLFWSRANKTGALAGMSGGLAVWLYTLVLPSLSPIIETPPQFLANGPWAITWLRPQALFGLEWDPISHATLWSLLVNITLFVFVSLLARPSTVEQAQARAFTDPLANAHVSLGRRRAITTLEDLRELAVRFAGDIQGADVFDNYVDARRSGRAPLLDNSGLADLDAVRFVENLIAGAIGGASARVIMAASLQSASLSRGAAMAMLDEASEALQFNRKLLEATLESVPQGICVMNEDLAIAAWNSRFVELLALPDHLMRIGLPLADLIAFNTGRGEYRTQDFPALLVNRDIAGQTWPYIYERHRPDGTVLEITFDLMPGGGFVATFLDVTERHRAAEALREANETLELRVRERTEALELAKAEAEQANASKTRFLAAASHDLLQPLSAARLFVSALQERLNRGIDDAAARADVDRYTAGAAGALSSTEQLLDGLLDISALDSRAMKPDIGTFDMHDLLQQLATEFMPVAQRKGLRLSVVKRRIFVRSDPRLVRRILQNFLSNAIRYTRTGRIVIGGRRRGNILRVEVWDTGIGVPPDKQREIFGEFQRLDTGQDHSDKGLGLGLAIVERVSRLLGLTIGLRSRPGKGSCFHVDIPIAAHVDPATRPVQRTEERRASRSLRILCVDNEVSVLEGFQASFSEWGHTVFLAIGPDEALAHPFPPPDLFILDLHLNDGANGLDLLESLRKVFPAETPALLVTAARDEAIATRAKTMGCEILYKPIKPAALRRFVTSVALKMAPSSEKQDRGPSR